MKKILIIVAMESELDGFLKNDNYKMQIILGLIVFSKQLNNKTIYLSKCNVGKVNACCLATSLILKLKPNYVVNAGIGGGLTNNLNLLDVVASSKVAYHDFDLTAFNLKKGQLNEFEYYFKASKKLLDLLDNNVKKGLIVSGDQFISGLEPLKQIKKDFPKALVCDMEGCAIAHTCYLLSKKFVVIRAISDNVFLDNHINIYQDYKELAIEKVVQVVNNLISKIF